MSKEGKERLELEMRAMRVSSTILVAEKELQIIIGEANKIGLEVAHTGRLIKVSPITFECAKRLRSPMSFSKLFAGNERSVTNTYQPDKYLVPWNEYCAMFFKFVKKWRKKGFIIDPILKK